MGIDLILAKGKEEREGESYMKIKLRNRRKAISYVVAYLVLVVAAFVADAVLAAVFMNYLGHYESLAPQFVQQVGGGSVVGTYLITPLTIQTTFGPPGRPGPTVVETVTGLIVTLVNPSPFPTEAVLLGYYSGVPVPLLDVLGELGLTSNWSNYRVMFTKARWFGNRVAVYLEPGQVVDLAIPSAFGIPAKLLACTPTGCSLLKREAGVEGHPAPAASWVIRKDKESPPPPTPRLEEVAEYFVREKYQDTVVLPPTNSGTNISMYKGSVMPFNALRGLPPTVFAGYYSTDPAFSFTAPPSVRILGSRYELPAFSESGADPAVIPQDWAKWSSGFTTTLQKNITVWMDLAPYEDDRNVPFFKIWGKSQYIYVFVAVRGHADVTWVYKVIDRVTVTVIYVDADGVEHVVNSLSATGYADNSADLATNPYAWAIPTDAVRIIIEVDYEMSGTYLLRSPPHPVRVAWYAALIPEEWLG